MYDDIGQRILTGNSIQLPEYDEDDDLAQNKSEEEEALKSYWIQSVLSSIGTDEFQESFMMVLDKIRNDFTLIDQKHFCLDILNKIKEVYDFELPVNIEILSIDEIWQVYNLIAFIEYNHKGFVIEVWKKLEVDSKLIDIDLECKTKSDKIVSVIDSIAFKDQSTQMIKMFLGTNIKENLISWFNSISKKNLHLIKFELMKMEGV